MVVRAKDLLAMDTNLFSEDSSDPYVIVRFDDLEMTSKVIKKTRDPTWNFDCQLAISREKRDTGSLELEVWDKDHVPPDDFLGRIRVPLKKLCHVKATESWQVVHRYVHLWGVANGPLPCKSDDMNYGPYF